MKTYTIGQFAKLCDVSIKTLRHYEKLAILKPKYNPDNGYRRYLDADVRGLEAILALKTLGFSLVEISNFFNENKEVNINLKQQKQALLKKSRSLNLVITAIDKIDSETITNGDELENWVTLVKEVKMENKKIQWYLNQSEADMKAQNLYKPNISEAAVLKTQWQELIARAKVQMNDFNQSEFDTLANEWIVLVGLFIEDNNIMKSLFKGYSTMQDWPVERQLFDPEIGVFIGPKLVDKIS